MKKLILAILLMASCAQQEQAQVQKPKEPKEFKDVPSYLMEAFYKRVKNSEYAYKLDKNSFAGLVDFSVPSSEKRLYLLDLKTKTSEVYHVSHGAKSGDGKGNAVKFSNVVGSHMSSLGLYITGVVYNGAHAYSMKLHGKDKTNDNAYRRAVVMHEADYATQEFIDKNNRLGRSSGCFGIDPKYLKHVVDSLKDGSLFFAYGGEK